MALGVKVGTITISPVDKGSGVTLGKKLDRTNVSLEERGSRVAFGVRVGRTVVKKRPGVTLGERVGRKVVSPVDVMPLERGLGVAAIESVGKTVVDVTLNTIEGVDGVYIERGSVVGLRETVGKSDTTFIDRVSCMVLGESSELNDGSIVRTEVAMNRSSRVTTK